jgi:hypothetical protein
MPLMLILSVALQFACLVHVFRTGRPYWWAWIILIGSFLGVAVYILTQVLPELGNSSRTRRAARRVRHLLDPDHERRKLDDRLAVSDTVHNRLQLARERIEAGDPCAAEPLLEACLTGLHATDPDIMLDLARCRFLRGDFAACRHTLEALIAANPDFRSTQGHLLYARALEKLGAFDAALAEYATLAPQFPGEEGRVRHGLLLKQLGRTVEANQVFRESLQRARLAPRHYWRSNQEWIERARAESRQPVS